MTTPRLAIIPARGGSKRLPRKNVLPFMGQPMLAYPVHACLDSGLFDRVIVSTEDDEIAEAARAAGAEVAGRTLDLSSDRAGVADVCADLIAGLAAAGYEPAVFCCVYATAVFVTADDLRGSLALIGRPPEADAVMGVSSYDLQPHIALRDDGPFLTPMWSKLMNRKSQDVPDLVASNGTVYWLRTEAFRRSKSFYPTRLKGYKIPRRRAIDIDTDDDYRFALALAEISAAGS